MKQVFLLLLLMNISATLTSQKIIKVELVFKGVVIKEHGYSLEFADKSGRKYGFNAQRSNTAPYVFYNTAPDGGIKENERIKGIWFLLGYIILKAEKVSEKIIITIEELKKASK